MRAEFHARRRLLGPGLIALLLVLPSSALLGGEVHGAIPATPAAPLQVGLGPAATDLAAPRLAGCTPVPCVGNTLVLANNSLVSGNFLADNPNTPFGAAYDAATDQVFVADFGSSDVVVISDRTNSVVATIPVAAQPLGVAYDSGKSEIFVASDVGNVTSVISTVTDRVVDVIHGGVNPTAVTYDSGLGEVFVANQGSDNVSVISDETDSVVASVNVGTAPFGAAYDSGRSDVFVTNRGSDNVSVISDSNNQVAATVAVGSDPTGIAYDSGKGEVFAVNQFSSNVSVISDLDDKVTAQVHLGSNTNSLAATYDAATGEVLVANDNDANVSVISDTTDTVVTSVPVGLHPDALAYDSGLGEIFAPGFYAGNVSVFSDVTDKVVAWIHYGVFPASPAFDGGKGEVFVPNLYSNNVSVISNLSGRVVATLGVGDEPGAAVYDSGQSEVFVANYQSSNVSVVADGTNKVSASIAVGSGPQSLAYDSGRGEVWVADSGSDQISVISDSTNVVATTLSDPYGPDALAYDSGASEIFVGQEDSNNVTVLDDSSGKPLANIGVGGSPSGIAYDSGKGEVFVVDPASNNVSVISDTTNKVVANINVGTDPISATYDPTMGEVIVTNSNCPNGPPCSPGTVSIISDRTNHVLRTVEVGSEPFGGADDAGSQTVYVSNLAQGTISTLLLNATKVSGPTISSFTATPSSFELGSSTELVVSASGGVGPLSYQYVDLPAGCSSANLSAIACMPTTTGGFGVTVFVNDSAGHSAHAFAIFTVTVGAPTIASFTVSPTSVPVGSSANFTVQASGGSPPLSYAYAGLPAGCITMNASTLPCMPTAVGLYNVSVYVNDTAHRSASASAELTVTEGSTAVLTSVSALPASASVTVGGTTAAFTATPSCSATCPGTGLTYAWTLNQPSWGTLASPSSASTTFTAGSTTGTDYLFVNASLGSATVMAGPIPIKITSLPPAALTGLTLSPSSVTLATGGSANLSATPVCDGACPTGTSYAWTLTSPLAALNSTVGDPVLLTAGATAGRATIYLNATLDGVTREATASLSVLAGSGTTLSSVAISPMSAALSTGGAQTFSASVACTSGSCQDGVTLAWSLSNSLGTLSTAYGSTTTFTAGNVGGAATLTVHATLGQTSAWANATISVSAHTGASSAGFLGLGGDTGYYVVGALLGIAVVVGALLWARNRREPSAEIRQAAAATATEPSTPEAPTQGPGAGGPSTGTDGADPELGRAKVP